MDWAVDKSYIHFITGLGGNSVLFRRVEDWVKSAEKSFKYGGIPVKTYRTFKYKAGSWKNQQRVVVKIEVGPMGRNIRFIVTSFQGSTSKALYEEVYCDRGRQELMIKELKTYLYADRMSCNSFKANQFRLFLHAAAYVLLHKTKKEFFKRTLIEDCSILTFREKILLSPVFITTKKKTILIEFSKRHPLQEELTAAYRHLRQSA